MKGKGPQAQNISEVPKRARSIAELEERLEKIKSKSSFNLKTKLMKKSLSSKLNKKIKKQGRVTKPHVKPTGDLPGITTVKKEKKVPNSAKIAKPVFNTDGKLVFSKFDFANMGEKGKKIRTYMYKCNKEFIITIIKHVRSGQVLILNKFAFQKKTIPLKTQRKYWKTLKSRR